MIKLLKIKVEGIDLFDGPVEIDFFASQRVFRDNCDMLSNEFGEIFTNNVISIAGKNASGKTTILNLISSCISIMNGEKINRDIKDFFYDSDKIIIDLIFFNDIDSYLYRLSSTIVSYDVGEIQKKYKFVEEKLFRKKSSKIKSKKDMINIVEEYRTRTNEEEFLQTDISIVSLITKENTIAGSDLIVFTNLNILPISGDFPPDIIKFLDPTIEYIKFNKETEEYKLKFTGKGSIFTISRPEQLAKYLSSGTVKGLMIFINIIMTLQTGGYLLIDELENHFNREIVSTIIRIFTDKNLNKKGSTLIFSTHYAELLDDFERTDNIYIVFNEKGIKCQKLSDKINRNDIKKSEIFKSAIVFDTAPSYEDYMNLIKFLTNCRLKSGDI